MKKYQKPIVLNFEFKIQEKISSLNQWLNQNNLTDAGITTYVINS